MSSHPYEHALIVTNFFPEAEEHILKQVNELKVTLTHVQFSLLHVIVDIPSFYFQMPSTIDIQKKLYEQAKKHINILGETLAIPEQRRWVILDDLEEGILSMARKLRVDLIITGEKDDFGIFHLFRGSIIDNVIHRAPCNVLCLH